jgi:hypothetical protein
MAQNVEMLRFKMNLFNGNLQIVSLMAICMAPQRCREKGFQ